MRSKSTNRATAALAVALTVVLGAIIVVGALAGAMFLVLAVWLSIADSDDAPRIPKEVCRTDQLVAEAHFGTSGAQDGLFTLRAAKGTGPCLVSSQVTFRFLDGRDVPLTVEIGQHKADYQIVVGRPVERPALARVLPPEFEPSEEEFELSRSSASVLFTWGNWCGVPPLGALKIAALMPDASELSAVVDGSVDANGNTIVPACDEPTETSSIDFGRGLGCFGWRDRRSQSENMQSRTSVGEQRRLDLDPGRSGLLRESQTKTCNNRRVVAQ